MLMELCWARQCSQFSRRQQKRQMQNHPQVDHRPWFYLWIVLISSWSQLNFSSSWWFQPIWKILVKLDSISPSRGENKKYLKQLTTYRWVPQTSATWPRYAPAWHSLVKRHYCTTDVGQGFNPGKYGEKWWCYIYVGWLVVEAYPQFRTNMMLFVEFIFCLFRPFFWGGSKKQAISLGEVGKRGSHRIPLLREALRQYGGHYPASQHPKPVAKEVLKSPHENSLILGFSVVSWVAIIWCHMYSPPKSFSWHWHHLQGRVVAHSASLCVRSTPHPVKVTKLKME